VDRAHLAARPPPRRLTVASLEVDGSEVDASPVDSSPVDSSPVDSSEVDGGGAPAPPDGRAAAGLRARLGARCRWPPDRPSVTLAVSGGPDSLALLVLARSAGLDVVAIHVDHGLRPGSAGEAAVVEAAAHAWGARFEGRRVDVAAGPNLEARARAARLGALPADVLTGHTADDQAETLLLNVMRGAGLDGLAAMAGPGRSRKPILALRRSETHALCAAVGLQVVTDPSNAALAHRRNAVRHRLVPLLAEIARRDPVPVLVRQSDLLADDAAYLEALADALDPTDARALRAAPLPLARRAVRRWLRAGSDDEHHPPSAAEVGRVLAVARGEALACELAGGRRVIRRAGRLHVVDPPRRSRVAPDESPESARG
jgi:tRNA(Ile)-lysidine synthase